MERDFNPAISEEMMAAYLDGMLSEEENMNIEESIFYDSGLQDILDSIDSVDSLLIADENTDIPIECLSDDFMLPSLDIMSADLHEISPEINLFNGEYIQEEAALSEADNTHHSQPRSLADADSFDDIEDSLTEACDILADTGDTLAELDEDDFPDFSGDESNPDDDSSFSDDFNFL